MAGSGTPGTGGTPAAPTAPTDWSASEGNIAIIAEYRIQPTEEKLEEMLETLDEKSTAADLLKFQAKLAENSTLVACFSGVLKERTDAKKGVVQKF